MERRPDEVLRYMTELEGAAEEILAERRQIIDLDARRQKTREAMRAVQKDKTSDKTWMCVNNLFVKLPKQRASSLLKKDFDELDEEISRLRDSLRARVNQLRDLENKDALKGFQLSPLSKQEMDAIKDIL